MIGKAIYKLLKTHLSNVATGGIYPIIIPENAIDLSSSPAIVYNILTDYETSKNVEPEIVKAVVEFRIISKTYATTNEVSKNLRYLLDHYRDETYDGLDGIRGYLDLDGNNHNLINGIDIANIFYQDQEDDYIDDLFLYSRSIVYNIYYYDSINKFSFTDDPITNNLVLSCKVEGTIHNHLELPNIYGALLRKADKKRPKNNESISKWFNTLGTIKTKPTPSATPIDSRASLQGFGTPTFKEGGSVRPHISIDSADAFGVYSSSDSVTTIDLSNGGLMVFIYKPTGTGSQNLLVGDYSLGSLYNPAICVSHKKVGSDITIDFNPRGDFASFSSETKTLKTSTDSTNYWDADYHFLALSVGGNKAQTGGTYNQSGWYEYFNSNYNPKLTTGQIFDTNSFTGNSVTYSNSCTFAGIGGFSGSAGFDLYEFLVFVPETTTTHGYSADTAPFQPTDITYKKLKDYIYNKYTMLK